MQARLATRGRRRLAIAVTVGLVLGLAAVGTAAASVGTMSISGQNPNPVVQGSSATFNVTVTNSSTSRDGYFRAYELRTTSGNSTSQVQVTGFNCVAIDHAAWSWSDFSWHYYSGTLSVTVSTPGAPVGADTYRLYVREYEGSNGLSDCNSNHSYDDDGHANLTINVVAATTTTLVSSSNPSLLGSPVTFSATVSPSVTGGTVTFYDGATSLGTGSRSGSVFSLTTSGLSAGAHSITAVYGGDSTHAGSTSNVVSQFVASPSISLTKVGVAASDATAGDSIDYTYAIMNTGNVTIDAPFSVDDSLIASVDCSGAATSIDPGDSTTCTASYTITQADVDNGSVYNSATATGHYQSLAVTALGETTVELSQTHALGLAKAATESTFTQAGDTIHYTYTLTNTGNATLDGPFSVADDKIASVACPDTATLAPGASIECTGTYSVTAADVTAGSVVNTATAHGFYNTEVEIASATASASVTLAAPVVTDPPAATPTPFESFEGVTALPTQVTTPPPTSTSNSDGGGAAPLAALLICLAFGGLGLAVVEGQRRTIRP
jgi:Bacterial Ig-like domain (group 3)